MQSILNGDGHADPSGESVIKSFTLYFLLNYYLYFSTGQGLFTMPHYNNTNVPPRRSEEGKGKKKNVKAKRLNCTFAFALATTTTFKRLYHSSIVRRWDYRTGSRGSTSARTASLLQRKLGRTRICESQLSLPAFLLMFSCVDFVFWGFFPAPLLWESQNNLARRGR